MAFSESILTIIRDVAPRLGINKPNAATGSTDPQIVQLVALANEETQELGARYPWTVLDNECSFTTVATEAQGTLTGQIIPAGQVLGYVLGDTMWNRTQKINVPGPISPAGWQGVKALNSAGGFWSRYRIRANQLLFYPTPAAGQLVVFEFISESTVLNADGSAYSTIFSKDDDVSLLSSRLIKLGLKWRWKQAKGLDYAEDFDTYEAAVADAMARDGTKPTLDMGRSQPLDGISPVVVVPRANWTL